MAAGQVSEREDRCRKSRSLGLEMALKLLLLPAVGQIPANQQDSRSSSLDGRILMPGCWGEHFQHLPTSVLSVKQAFVSQAKATGCFPSTPNHEGLIDTPDPAMNRGLFKREAGY